MDKQMDGRTDRWTYGWMDGQMDKHTDKNPPVFYRTSFPWGLLPKNKNSHNYSHFWPFQALWAPWIKARRSRNPHNCSQLVTSNHMTVYKQKVQYSFDIQEGKNKNNSWFWIFFEILSTWGPLNRDLEGPKLSYMFSTSPHNYIWTEYLMFVWNKEKKLKKNMILDILGHFVPSGPPESHLEGLKTVISDCN